MAEENVVEEAVPQADGDTSEGVIEPDAVIFPPPQNLDPRVLLLEKALNGFAEEVEETFETVFREILIIKKALTENIRITAELQARSEAELRSDDDTES